MNESKLIVTVYDFLQIKKMKGTDLAKETGLSQALVSKLRLNQSPLTEKVKRKLQETYPGYVFTCNGLDANWAWKDKYYQSLDIVKQQRRQIQNLEEKLKLSRKARNALRVLVQELL